MKIDCEIISVQTTGDGLRIAMQGKPPTAAEWRPIERHEIVIPSPAGGHRSFYVGRRVVLSITPK